MIAVDSGGALAGTLDGKVYPIDLVAGTVGAPLSTVNPTATIADMLLEPAGLFATPGSFLVSDDQGTVARYCTTLGAPPAVPALGPYGLPALLLAVLGTGTLLGHRARRSSLPSRPAQ
jgi:hypothetical protein